jgi:hypothetical protein
LDLRISAFCDHHIRYNVWKQSVKIGRDLHQYGVLRGIHRNPRNHRIHPIPAQITVNHAGKFLRIRPGFTRRSKIPSLFEHPLADLRRSCPRGRIRCFSDLRLGVEVTPQLNAQLHDRDQDNPKASYPKGQRITPSIIQDFHHHPSWRDVASAEIGKLPGNQGTNVPKKLRMLPETGLINMLPATPFAERIEMQDCFIMYLN